MKYGIICAMKEEIELIRQDISSASITVIGDREFICGNLYGNSAVLVMSRIGKVAAATTATVLIDRFNVDAIIFCGTAGGISPELNVGDVVVADSCVQHDFDAKMSKPFLIPLIMQDYLKTDTYLTDRACMAAEKYIAENLSTDIPKKYLVEFGIDNPKMVVGTIASGDVFVCDSDSKERLLTSVNNIKCTEMEGAAVAQVCYEFGVPYTVIRVISDGANEASVVNFDKFVQEAASHLTRGFVKAFLENK